jgi:cysteinyl-tRNA synthetase
MSKSEKNVILAKDFYQKYGANVLRFLFLNAYHNKTINFDEKLVQQAENYIQKTKNLLKKLNFYLYIAGAETLMRQNSTKSTTIMNEMNVEQ